MVASESVALDSTGYKLIRDVKPGEAVFIDTEGNVHTRLCSDKTGYTPCIFEYVYFARPDTILDGISVYRARMRMGQNLAKKIKKEWKSHNIDVVIPIPDTSRIAALELSTSLKVPFREGFIKNRYIGRTFIMPEQMQRIQSVKRKLNAIGSEFKGIDFGRNYEFKADSNPGPTTYTPTHSYLEKSLLLIERLLLVLYLIDKLLLLTYIKLSGS